MSKAVLISIQPKWCRLIERGEKTVEVRKTRPKLETPFKCYIYCTLSGCNEFFRETLRADVARWNKGKWGSKKGHVIGEFVCSGFDEFTPTEHGVKFKRFFALHDSGLSAGELRRYLNGNPGYGWRISDLVIYDNPLELCNFVVEGDCDCLNCRKCIWLDKGNGYNVEDDCALGYEFLERGEIKPLFRPPQSWCYVEWLKGDTE